MYICIYVYVYIHIHYTYSLLRLFYINQTKTYIVVTGEAASLGKVQVKARFENSFN